MRSPSSRAKKTYGSAGTESAGYGSEEAHGRGAMAGTRVFDDDRWPDNEGYACCFLCGRKVDPSDPHRASYSSNAAAGGFLPAHGQCLSARLSKPHPHGQIEIEVAHRVALLAM